MVWARNSIGVTIEEAAQRAGVKPDRVEAWESGELEPTVPKLRALAKLYQRPFAVFFLPEPPTDFDVMRDFRRLPSAEDHRWSRALHKVYRRSLEQQEIAAELLDEADEELVVNLPALDVEMDPEDAGAVARAVLGVELPEQFGWRTPEESFGGWMQAVEDRNVFVLRTSDVSIKEMRGFSISSGIPPVIVVNALDWPRGQVFTLAHEFMHLLVREGGLCDLLEPTAGPARQVEAFCNAAAAAMLMPASSFLDHDVVGPAGVRTWDAAVLAQLSGRYGVSQEAVLRRLVTLRRASMDFYLEQREEYLEAYGQQREDEKARRQGNENKGGPPPHRMAIRDRGKPYVRLVLDAYHRDEISPSSLSSFLGLKLRHVPALEREAG